MHKFSEDRQQTSRLVSNHTEDSAEEKLRVKGRGGWGTTHIHIIQLEMRSTSLLLAGDETVPSLSIYIFTLDNLQGFWTFLQESQLFQQ